MSANGVLNDIKRNDRTMSNGLPSSESTKRDDQCCGIHGAARRRKGIKKGTNSARRRNDKNIVSCELEEMEDEQVC